MKGGATHSARGAANKRKEITSRRAFGIWRVHRVVVRTAAKDGVMRDSLTVFTISRRIGMVAGLGVLLLVVWLLAACQEPHPQKGGYSTSTMHRAGHTNSATLAQSENPKEPSRQTMLSEQTVDFVLPAGSAIMPTTGPAQEGCTAIRPAQSALSSMLPPGTVVLAQPMPVRMALIDRTETSLGGAQKDTLREWAGRAANLQPVMWAGIGMMTLVAGALLYFGWWTKAALAAGVGLGMIILAQALPDRGNVILLGGLAVFGVAALLVLNAYHKGQLDKKPAA